jgi:DNA-binding response OmpR family regulator
MRVLVAVADAEFTASIRQVLETAGLAVDAAEDRDGADASLRRNHYDAIALDLQISNGAGESLLQALRARNDRTPVLVLTGACPVAERVRLLDLGADDYLLKPVDVIELGARLRALIRRSSTGVAEKLVCGPLQLLRHDRVATVGGKRIDLTNREFWILDALMRNENHSMSRRQLEESLYGWGDEVESNAIEVHIHHLRRKLGAGLIQTVRGVGYQLVAARERAETSEPQARDASRGISAAAPRP